jgi:hypothetical protein
VRSVLLGCSSGRRRAAVSVRIVVAIAVLLVSAASCSGKSSAVLRWRGPLPIKTATAGTYWSLSCATSHFCAAESGVDQVVYTRSGWGHPTGRNTCADNPAYGCSQGAVGISCASVRFCAFVDPLGNAYTYNGHSWSRPVAVVSPDEMGGTWVASCPTNQYCVVVDSLGVFVTYSAGKWLGARPIYPDSSAGEPGIWSLSCPTTSFCAAGAAGHGSALTYNGTDWSQPSRLDSGTAKSPVHVFVSCPTNTFCAAVDTNGNAFTFSGTSWTRPVPVDGTGEKGTPLTISCPTPRFCLATDGGGNVLLYKSGKWDPPKHLASADTGPLVASCPTPPARRNITLGAAPAIRAHVRGGHGPKLSSGGERIAVVPRRGVAAAGRCSGCWFCVSSRHSLAFPTLALAAPRWRLWDESAKRDSNESVQSARVSSPSRGAHRRRDRPLGARPALAAVPTSR